jgi:hypothetical protein
MSYDLLPHDRQLAALDEAIDLVSRANDLVSVGLDPLVYNVYKLPDKVVAALNEIRHVRNHLASIPNGGASVVP